METLWPQIERILPTVSKPARYIGGEQGSLLPVHDAGSVAWLLLYPDTYEIGLPNQGLQILYEILNERPDALAERAYAPWVDMEAAMRAAGIPLFSVEQRVEMLRETVKPYANVEIDSFNGLLADYALTKKASVILRGIRAISDYENELQMALMNRRLQPGLETVFLLAGEAFSFISSRLVKEVISLGGNITGLVPPLVDQRLRERLQPARAKAQTPNAG